MPNLLCELEIDAACWEFLAHRIVARGGTKPPQPIVTYLDRCEICDCYPCACPKSPFLPLPTAFVCEPPEDDGWDELTARAARYGSGPETVGEMTERLLAKMDV